MGRDVEGIGTRSSDDASASVAYATASGAARSSRARDLTVRVAANERSGTNSDKNDLRKFRKVHYGLSCRLRLCNASKLSVNARKTFSANGKLTAFLELETQVVQGFALT